MTPVHKGAGSIIASINKMLDMIIVVTSRSKNIIYELDNYCWEKDKDGNYINKPMDGNNHAMDAVRYFVLRFVLGWGDKERRRDYTGVF